ncbi:MAG: hypothetical protein ACLVKK_07235 [Ruthenibacterium sp.]
MKNFDEFHEGMIVRLITVENESYEGKIGDIIEADDNPEVDEEIILLDNVKELHGGSEGFLASYVSSMEILDK